MSGYILDSVATVRPIRIANQPVPIHSQALANLRYIRETMESAGQFTAIPGRGGIAMGLTAFVAAALAHPRMQAHAWTQWLAIWSGEAVFGIAVALFFARRKSRLLNKPLLEGPGRKFVLALLPPIFVAALLTGVLLRAGMVDFAPAIWLLLYGCGIVAGGAFSVRVVPVMGLCFLLLGTFALFTSRAWGDAWLAAGFGAVQMAFGWIIARHHGG